MKILSAVLISLSLCWSCGTSDSDNTLHTENEQRLPALTYDPTHLFPADASLQRNEDGHSLPDGRIIVSDQRYGLSIVEPNGEHRPFGKFEAAGFVPNSPEHPASPNGAFMMQDGIHMLMTDIISGKIFRINVEDESVEMIYDHPVGVNTMVSDSKGNIYFTQSSDNSPESGFAGVFKDVDNPRPNGAIFRLKAEGESFSAFPELLYDSLYFANGIVLDAEEKYLYVAETMMDRVWRFPVLEDGAIGAADLFCTVGTPDNLMLDKQSRLWVASPLYNEIVVFSQDGRNKFTVFSGQTTANQKIIAEYMRRALQGLPRLEVLTPEQHAPLPGMLTGMFLSPDEKTLYITNLGNAVLKYPI